MTRPGHRNTNPTKLDYDHRVKIDICIISIPQLLLHHLFLIIDITNSSHNDKIIYTG